MVSICGPEAASDTMIELFLGTNCPFGEVEQLDLVLAPILVSANDDIFGV